MIKNFQNLHSYKNSHKKCNGVTLLELAIVIIVIGLIIGGVIVGNDLIKASRLRSIISSVERYNAAVSAFENKYSCIPGDCKKATSFFSANQDCAGATGTHTNLTTCNGDGDGLVTLTNPSDPPGANSWYYDETVLFWQQLSISGLIEGSYSGKMDATNYVITGNNVPKTDIKNACLSVNSSGYLSADAATKLPYNDTLQVPFDRGNMFVIGNPKLANGTGAASNSCIGGLRSLPAISAYNIDIKIDDGRPFAGSVQSMMQLDGGLWNYSGNSNPGCTNQNAAPDVYATTWSEYDILIEKAACQLFFKATF